MKKTIFLTLGVLGAASLSAHAALINRYSFNNPAGVAPDGSVLTDSVSGADGVVRGANAAFTGTGLDLPGGSSNTEAYGDLPNGLISTHQAVTLEGWVTIDAGGNNWARILDFGSTNPGGAAGEITGPGNTNGGGTDGLDYILLSAARGGNYDQQRIEIRNEDPAGGGIATFDSNVVTAFPDSFHFAVSWQNIGGGQSQVDYWRNGTQLTTGAIANSTLQDLNDVNNWLGRSNWLNDGNLNGTYDEFRIWDEPVDQAYVDAAIAAGSGVVVPEPSTLGLFGLAGLALILRRRVRR